MFFIIQPLFLQRTTFKLKSFYIHILDITANQTGQGQFETHICAHLIVLLFSVTANQAG